MRDTLYVLGFLVIAGLLLFIGRDLIPSSTILTWIVTFGATAAVGVLLISLFRVQQELKQSRFELARKDVELQIAREVQAALFPKTLPLDRGLSFSAICIPAQGISGDYYGWPYLTGHCRYQRERGLGGHTDVQHSGQVSCAHRNE